MLISNVLSCLAAVASSQSQPMGTLPAGNNSQFLASFKAATTALSQKNYAKASMLAARLPKNEITLVWNESKIPAASRADYRNVANKVQELWQTKIPELKIKWVTQSPDVEIKFAPSLPTAPGSTLPAGATFLQSADPKLPPMVCTIALKRDQTLADIGPREIYNEMNFALATYFGLARLPVYRSVSTRIDGLYNRLSVFDASEINVVKQNLAWTKKLRDAIKLKKPLAIGFPKLSTDIESRLNIKGIQGDQLPFAIGVSNQGNAAMTFYAVPDCSCFRLPSFVTVQPGSTEFFPVTIDSSEFPGVHSKKLLLFSNDPDQPVKEFLVKFNAEPRYEWLDTNPDRIYQMPENGLVLKVQLAVNPKRPFKITGASLNGREGALDFAPWVSKDKSKPKSGTEFTLLLSPDISAGRDMLSIEIQTDDPFIQYIRYPFYVQKGIAVMPYSIYLGNIERKTISATAVLSYPHRPFKVLGVKTDSSFLKAKIEPIKKDNTEYRVTAYIMNPKDAGVYEGNVIVTTDCPGQETITIPVLAKVTD